MLQACGDQPHLACLPLQVDQVLLQLRPVLLCTLGAAAQVGRLCLQGCPGLLLLCQAGLQPFLCSCATGNLHVHQTIHSSRAGRALAGPPAK